MQPCSVLGPSCSTSYWLNTSSPLLQRMLWHDINKTNVCQDLFLRRFRRDAIDSPETTPKILASEAAPNTVSLSVIPIQRASGEVLIASAFLSSQVLKLGALPKVLTRREPQGPALPSQENKGLISTRLITWRRVHNSVSKRLARFLRQKMAMFG